MENNHAIDQPPVGGKEAARAYVLADRVHHGGMLAVLDEPETEILYAAPDGLLLLYGGWLYLVSAKDERTALEMLPLIANDGADVLLHQSYLSAALEARGMRRQLRCHPCLYERRTPIPIEPPDGVTFRWLTKADAPFVHEHYRGGSSSASYIETRIEAGMLGLYENDALAGFIGMHDEQEMGLLEILPAYRRKGYAYLLEAQMINELLRQNRVINCEVEVQNDASMALQRKLGITVGSGIVTWYGRD